MDTNEPRNRAIVFVDVDGVLNNWIEPELMKTSEPISKNNVKVFNKLIKELQNYCKIDIECILTSTWRLKYNKYSRSEAVERIQKDFDNYGLKCSWEGLTDQKWFVTGYSYHRGYEIDKWLWDNCRGANISFIILDDERDMGRLEEHLVYITGKTGLLEVDIFDALRKIEKVVKIGR